MRKMYQVIKRDGKITDFDLNKVSVAITKAFEAQNKQYVPAIIDMLTLRVTADFENKIENNLVHVEDIQDSVEHVLEQSGYTDVAKAYILYRKQREKIRNMKSTILDYKEVVNNYVHLEDWRVKENSTVTYSVGGLILRATAAQSPQTTGFRKFTTKKSHALTKTPIFTSTICRCSPVTAPVGR